MSPLPGPDSSVTLRGGRDPLFVHTLGRESGPLVEGFRRADGLRGTAEVLLAEGHPTRWTFRWVSLESDPRRTVYEAGESGLIADGDVLEPPTSAWGVAEYGMAGTLIPSLLAVGAKPALPFSIYRPTPQTWDRIKVSSRRFEDFTHFLLSSESGAQTALIVDANGILLYQAVTNADGSNSVRIPTNPDRQSQLRRVLSALQG